MQNITPQQERKLKKLIALGEQGLPALLEYLFEIEEKLDVEMPAIMEVIDRITAETDEGALMSKIEEAVKNATPVIDYNAIAKLITVENGKDYILTEKDKREIASKIIVPKPQPDKIIEKTIVEKTEVKIEQPIEIIKEVAVITDREITSRGEAIRDGLELLQDEDRLDKKAIKGLDDYDEVARLAKLPRDRVGGVMGIKEIIAGSNITVDNTNLGYPVISSAGGSSSNTLKLPLSTGLLTGGIITINAGNNTKFDVTAGTGIHVDNYTDPSNPVITEVSWGAQTGISATLLATEEITVVGVSSTGVISQNDLSDRENYIVDFIQLGGLIHPDHTTITSILPFGLNIAYGTASSLSDLAMAIGLINTGGNVYSSNGVNLKINKSAGTLFSIGANIHASAKTPNTLPVPSETPVGFVYTYQDGLGSFTSVLATDIDPAHYDNGTGTLATMPANKWVIHRVYLGNTKTAIQYGQNYYNSQDLAEAAIVTESFNQNPSLDLALIRCFLIVKSNATSLDTISDAKFVSAGRFGTGVSAGSTSSTTNLQQAYDNSTPNPEVLTNAIQGAIGFRRGSTLDTDDVFTVQDGAGVDRFIVTGEGVIRAPSIRDTTLIPSIEIDNRILKDSIDTESLTWENRYLKNSSGNITVDWNNHSLISSGVQTVDWGNGSLFSSGIQTVNWNGLQLSNLSGHVKYDWDYNLLYHNNGTQHAVIDIGAQVLYDIADQSSIRWSSRDMYASDGSTVLANYANTTGMRLYGSVGTGFSSASFTPSARIHAHSLTGIATYQKTTNSVTGALSTDGFDVGVSATGVAEIRQRENLAMEFYTNNALAMNILNSGNVGINIAVPVEKLHVAGNILMPNSSQIGWGTTAGSGVFMNYDGVAVRISPSGGAVKLRIETSKVSVGVDGSGGSGFNVFGNVGIGASYWNITAPASGLIVEGNTGIGVSGPSARLHIISTTEQLRSGYDATIYWRATTVNTTGVTTFNAVGGTTPSFVFSSTVTLPAGQIVNGVTLSNALGTGVYLRGDGTYSSVTASAPSLSISNLTATVNETVTAGYSAVVNRIYTINSGFSLTIGSGGIFRIL